MKKKKSLIRTLITITIIIYLLFGTNVVNNLKGSLMDLNNLDNNKIIEKNKFNNTLDVYFIDVGQADSILLKNNTHTMLIDAGNNSDGNKLVTYLKNLDIKTFDYVIATHPHEDHIGGMDDIINNFKIDKFLMPNIITTSKTFEDVLDALDKNELKYKVPKENEEYKLGDALIKIIYAGDSKSDLNDSSVIVKVTYGNNSFLFTGDATSKVEKNILNSDIKSDVLKVAHHGSDYSSSEEFIKVVSPSYAVISVGKDNLYKHPSFSTIEKLENKDIKIYRTDKNGTIIMSSDGSRIDVTTIITDTNG